jgi:hypothetical protein
MHWFAIVAKRGAIVQLTQAFFKEDLCISIVGKSIALANILSFSGLHAPARSLVRSHRRNR